MERKEKVDNKPEGWGRVYIYTHPHTHTFLEKSPTQKIVCVAKKKKKKNLQTPDVPRTIDPGYAMIAPPTDFRTAKQDRPDAEPLLATGISRVSR